MGKWRRSAVNRGIVVMLVIGTAVGAAACSSDDGDGDGKTPGSSSSPEGGSRTPEDKESEGGGGSTDPVAELKGKSDMVLSITEIKRDSGGFLTINGEMKNTGSQDFTDIANWGGNEPGLAGASLAGAALVDKPGKKRYYVLRDTEKRCLCTSAIPVIEAGKSIPVYIQFPAPPEKTKEIEFQLPTFTPTTLPLSE